MKGKERKEAVTKMVFSLSLSMYCIVISSSWRCNFANYITTMEKEKNEVAFLSQEKHTEQKRQKSHYGTYQHRSLNGSVQL